MGGKVTGTLEKPVFSADIEANNLVAGLFRVPMMRSKARLNGNKLTLTDLFADADPGTITGSAEYDTQTQKGTFASKLSGVEIERVLAAVAEVATVGGVLRDGEITGKFGADSLDEINGFVKINGF